MRSKKMSVSLQVIKFLILVSILAAGLFFVLTQITFDYYIVQPGTPLELSNAINVESNDGSGDLHLTTVSQSPANLIMLLYAVINSQADIQPKDKVIPPDMDQEQYREMMQQYMTDSQNIAKTIALEELDYDVEFSGDGIKVVELTEASPVRGVLEAGDIIKKVNGDSFYLAEELTDYISNYPINEKLELIIQRKGEELTKQVRTKENPDSSGDSYLGVYIRTENWEPLFPIDIEIDTGGIGGPSAGLMFALEIIDQLTDEKLSSGYSIYGTGAVDLDGSVNAVGGVNYKVAASEAEGADYFLVPPDNYKEAKEAALDIEIIEVNNIEEALDFLKSLSVTPANENVKLDNDRWSSEFFSPVFAG